ncbi:hypothetical protein I2F17_12235 [Acinetobacter sp. B10A]|uniref:hypothetical protein n=1 Tax=Acinetobacter baretiae TaxID=2605383 RepID=UPI001B3C888F|nr:hypothetical protein [Acinetobacter baretiae]MBF7686586.1 hypothetical protein [Acinetobacter baretiae]
MKKIIALMILILSSTFVYSANPPANNSSRKPTLAQDLSSNTSTTYKEISNVDVKPGTQTVSASYSDSIVKDGTRQGLTIEAVEVQASKAEAAAELAKRWGKRALWGANAVWLGAEVVGGLLKAVDYVMDPNNNTIKPKERIECGDNGEFCPNLEYVYSGETRSQYYADKEKLCSVISNNKPYSLQTLSPTAWYCRPSTGGILLITLRKNPSYKSSATSQSQEITTAEQLQKILTEALSKADQQQQIKAIKDAYTPIDTTTGQATTSVAQATNNQGLNTTMQNIISTAQSQLANNPDSATSNSGSTSTGTTTTTNPDGTTSTSTSSFQLPAFCSWATTICQFIDWFKKDPQIENEPQLQIDELKIEKYKMEEHAKFNATCPFKAETESIPFGSVGSMVFTKDLTPFCDYASDAKPFVVSLGHLGAIFFLIIGLRTQPNG